MSILEQKVDALIRVVLAEDGQSRRRAIDDLDAVMRNSSVVDHVSESVTFEERIGQILTEIGVPCRLHGYHDLIAAIRIKKDDTYQKLRLVRDIYPMVAKEAGGGRTPSQIERCIRHAIEVAWGRGDLDTLQKYFGNTISAERGKPTNAEFISRITLLADSVSKVAGGAL